MNCLKEPIWRVEYFFNRYFGLTKYHIYEESTSYPIIKKKKKKKKNQKKKKKKRRKESS